jgi:hypothetical protein
VPRDTIDSDRGPFLQTEESLGQPIFVDVMQQGSELERVVLSGSFAHAVQSK